MEKIKIMIAEDHPIFRNMLVIGLNTNKISVVGVAENGQVLMDLVKVNQPDVVLLDLSMPVLNGHQVLKIFAKDFKNIKTIILSSDYQPYYIASAIIDGASGYLSKLSDFPEIKEAIEEVYFNGFFFNDLVSRNILYQLRDETKKLYYLIENQKFSEREIQILKLISDEVPIEQIADLLNITKNTVLHHKKRLFEKTESDTRIALVKYAIRQGIVKNSNFLPKEESIEKVLEVIDIVDKEGIYTDAKVTTILTDKLSNLSKSSNAINLSPREREVLNLLYRTASTKQTADQLEISLDGLNSYLKKIMNKTGTKNTKELIKYAIENKLVNTAIII